MATVADSIPSSAQLDGIAPMLALSGAWTSSLVELHKMQLEAWFTWQKMLAANAQELQDEWVARFGGGVPIDG